MAIVGAVVAFGLVYFVLPRAVDLGSTLEQLRSGDALWLALGCLLAAGSIFGEIVLLRGLFSTPAHPLSWRNVAEITLASTAATKLVATAGAGGIALTVWALRAFRVPDREVADGMVAYELVTYGVYLAAVVVAGFGLWIGLFAGAAPVGVTLIPAAIAVATIAIVLSMSLVEKPAERRLRRRAERSKGRKARWLRRAAELPRTLHAGLLAVAQMLKRRDRSLLGAVAYWGFDIGVLGASFHAFGDPPPGAVIVMGYFIGYLGNALPLPGGVGGVEGGMIGAFLAFGVPSGLAVIAVLGYRTISYWLPTVPGAIAYVRLRHTLGKAPVESHEAHDQAGS